MLEGTPRKEELPFSYVAKDRCDRLVTSTFTFQNVTVAVNSAFFACCKNKCNWYINTEHIHHACQMQIELEK